MSARTEERNDWPEIAVAFLTAGYGRSIRELVESLKLAIAEYRGPCTVVCVAHTTGGTPQYLPKRLGSAPVLRVEFGGRAPAGRRLAAEATTAPWVLFVDDDCLVDSGILTAYAEKVRSVGEGGTAAIFGLTKFVGKTSTAFRACWLTPFVHPFQIAAMYDEVEWAPTSNSLFSQKALAAVGGFDTSNPVRMSGEDVDIGLRFRAAGLRCYTCPESIVAHTTATWSSLWGNVQRFLNYGRSEAWLAS